MSEDGVSIVTIGQAQRLFLSLHVACSVLLCAPLLLWAGAIARTPHTSVAGTFLFLLFYALTYGVWGLAALGSGSGSQSPIFIRVFFSDLLLQDFAIYRTLRWLLPLFSEDKRPGRWRSAAGHYRRGGHLVSLPWAPVAGGFIAGD